MIAKSGSIGRASTMRMVMVAVWAFLLVIGLGVVVKYDSTPGKQVDPSHVWPAESRITLDRSRMNLVMFVHPHCPCSRASLHQLEALLLGCKQPVSAQVVMVRPVGAEAGWSAGELDNLARSIPGVCVSEDVDGAEAVRFGAATSGQVLLYSPAGALLFQGGITASRGHEGDNAGSQFVIELIDRSKSVQESSPVFGCPLRGESDTVTIGEVRCP